VGRVARAPVEEVIILQVSGLFLQVSARQTCNILPTPAQSLRQASGLARFQRKTRTGLLKQAPMGIDMNCRRRRMLQVIGG
jgi:hypothetical protein